MSSGAAIRSVDTAVGLALQADARRATDALHAVAAEAFTGEEARFRAAMLDRFDRGEPLPVPAESGDELVDVVVEAFRSYWWHALTDRQATETQAARLLDPLGAIVGESVQALDELEPAVIRRLSERRLFALMGVTSPLRELMVWRSQETRMYDVELPEGRHTTRVELLDDFVSLGWSDYATCGRRGTGGWATRDGLFAVVPRYEGGLEGETFRVTFLGHETQHFADLTRYSEMEAWVLEYRAKLVSSYRRSRLASGSSRSSARARAMTPPLRTRTPTGGCLTCFGRGWPWLPGRTSRPSPCEHSRMPPSASSAPTRRGGPVDSVTAVTNRTLPAM